MENLIITINFLVTKFDNDFTVKTNGFEFRGNYITYFIELDSPGGIMVHIHKKIKEVSAGVWEFESAMCRADNIGDAIDLILVHKELLEYGEIEEILNGG